MVIKSKGKRTVELRKSIGHVINKLTLATHINLSQSG